MTPPLFSVILPTAGRRPELLGEAVASLRAQTVEDWECVVVDDASPAPVDVLDDPRIRVVRRDSGGSPAEARNEGLSHARGRLVTFLDDDDLYVPERLAIGIEGERRAPLALCWRTAIGIPASAARWRRSLRGENRILEGRISDVILDRQTPHLGQVTMRRELVPPFEARFELSTEVEWWIRVARTTPATTVPRVGYRFREHPGPRITDRLESRLRAGLMMLEEHADYFSTHRRAAAWRWRVIGRIAEQLGDRALARSAFLTALRLERRPRYAFYYLRSLTGTRSRAV